MNLKKLLFALANLSIVTSPILGVTACKNPAVVNKLDISGLTNTDVTPNANEIVAELVTAVSPLEIKAMFDRAVLRRMKALSNNDNVVATNDYDITVTTGSGGTLTTANFTLNDATPRTFLVTINSKESSQIITGNTGALQVVIPQQQDTRYNISNVITGNYITVSEVDYAPPAVKNVTAATPDEITELIITKTLIFINNLGGEAEDANDADFTVAVYTDSQGTMPLTGNTDLTSSTESVRTFYVVVTAENDSQVLTGANTTAAKVVFGQATVVAKYNISNDIVNNYVTTTDADYAPPAVASKNAATAQEITNLIASKTLIFINNLGGQAAKATASDFTVQVFTDASGKNALSADTDLTSATDAVRTFYVMVNATQNSSVLIGGNTTAAQVIFAQAK